jgi:hypothetical protein
MRHDAVHNRIRAEYLEMPGLSLNAEQVQRFCGIERGMCQFVLQSLVDEGFLCLKFDGRYARLTEGRVPRPTPATATLATKTELLKAAS